MHKLAFVLLAPAFLAIAQTNPFVGRWDFNITSGNTTRATWLGVTEKDGKLDIWFQPTGGNVYQVKDFKLDGSHLVLNLGTRPAFTWELDAKDGKLVGVQKRGESAVALNGVASPAL